MPTPTQTAPLTPTDTGIKSVHSLELFFDLVFVFTISQFTKLVAHPHHTVDYVQAGLAFLSVTWIYTAFVWLTSNIKLADSELSRWSLLLGMVCFFGIAVGIPHLAEGHGLLFGVAFLLAVALHFWLFWRADNSSHVAIGKLAPYNFATALLVFSGAVWLPSPYRWWVWGVAIVLHIVMTLRQKADTFPFSLSPVHFVERHGLIVIIALGEGVIALGTGASERPITTSLLAYTGAGLLLLATLWWAYFGLNQKPVEHQLNQASPVSRIALAARFSNMHYLLLAGCILVAAGFEVGVLSVGADVAINQNLATSHTISLAMIYNLAVGTGLYLLGLIGMRYSAKLPTHYPLWLGVLLCGATIPLAIYFTEMGVGEIAQLIALIVIMLGVGFSKVPE